MITNQTTSRNLGLGGSDIAAIFGLSPYKTPLELWTEKVGHPAANQSEGIHLRFGQHVEPFVAEEFEKATGLFTQEYEYPLTHPKHDFMFGHIDRFVVKDEYSPCVIDGGVVTDSLLECKTASIYTKDQWGPTGTDQVPNAYLLQCVWYMAITGCTTAHIAVLIGNSDFRTYRIEREQKLESMVIEQAKRFWFDNVLEGVPPAPKNSNDARLLFPTETPERTLQASHDLIERLNALRKNGEEVKKLEDESDQLKTQIMQAMGDAEQLVHGSQVLATWKSTKPAQRIDTATLKKQFPDIAQLCTQISPTTRRFVLKEQQ